MSRVRHLSLAELEDGFATLEPSPVDAGFLDLVVRRPATGEREVLAAAELDVVEGLRGDNWHARGSSRTADGSAHPEMQLTVMNSRVIDLIAGSRDLWPLAGDQLYVDLDLSAANLPPGTRLAVGTAVIEITPMPHAGCAKFIERFGADAMRFVNSPSGRERGLRGVNARVVVPGTVRQGDAVSVARAATDNR